MNTPRRLFTTSAVALAAIISAQAFATNGYFTHGTGTKNKAMAGAGIALPQDAIDTVNNPAVAVLVGDSMQLGIAAFSPRRDYSTSESMLNGQFNSFTIGPNDISSDNKYFAIPHFSRSWQRSENSAFAVSFYGRGGMNTDWVGGTATFDPDGPGPAPIMTLPGTFGNGTAGVNLSQAFIDLTWAWTLDNGLSVGVAPLIAIQVFKAEGVGTFAGYTETFAASGGTVMPENLSNNGSEYSYGAGLKLGLHKPLNDSVSLGLMYQSRVYMSKFDSYSDLFAEQGDFDVPANLKAGLTWNATDALALSFDIEHIWYSDVDSVGNSITNVFACPTAGQGGMDLTQCLGGDNGAGFGWDDMTTFKLGAQWSTSSDWTWRAGFSHGSSPLSSSEMTFNILAPAVMEDHFTFGFSHPSGERGEWNFSLMYAPEETLTGPQNFDPTQTVTFGMKQYEMELSYGWTY